MVSHSIDPSDKIGGRESIMRNGFAKREIKNSVFSKGKPQAGNC